MKTTKTLSFAVLFLSFLLLHVAAPSFFQNGVHAAAAFPFGFFGGGKPVESSSSPSSSSWLTVDPSKLLSTLTDKGGLFIPQTMMDGDIKVMRKAIHCEKSELDLLARNMILTNFTIGLKDRPPLLRVGRVFVHWDSYRDPMLTIEVGDVDVSVEFTNLMLTQTNWNQLVAIGFPPSFTTTTANTTTTKEELDYAWLRFDSILISGQVSLRITSEPLQRELGVLAYDMAALKNITDEIQTQSDQNYRLSGRRGLTAQGLAQVLQRYFIKSAQAYGMAHFQDIASVAANAANNKEALRTSMDQVLDKASKVLDKASNVVLDYALEATGKKAETVADKWKKTRWGGKLKELFVKVDGTITEFLKVEDNTFAEEPQEQKAKGKEKE